MAGLIHFRHLQRDEQRILLERSQSVANCTLIESCTSHKTKKGTDQARVQRWMLFMKGNAKSFEMQEDYDRNTLKILSKAAENSDTGVLTGA